MSDLISRQSAIDLFLAEGMVTSAVYMDRMPTIDAVPVVRCKDCKYWKLSQYNTVGIHICGRFSGVRGEHDFCSRGERKER